MRNYYKKRVSPWWRRGAIAVLALVALVAAVNLISYGVQLVSSRSLRAELKAELQQGEAATPTPVPAVIPEPTQAAAPTQAPVNEWDNTQTYTAETAPTAAPQPTAELSVGRLAVGTPEIRLALQGLWERNNDLVGWLQMDALPLLDLPVVQRDHTYYLRRDFYGHNNVNGTAFMDVGCSIWPRSDNLIIYAHNMKSGEMFGGLQKLRSEVYWRNKPMASFGSLYEKAEYVPVAVVLCRLDRGDDFFNFTVTDFRDEASFNAFVTRARELSDVYPPYDVRWGDDLLTLVTCHDEAHKERLVVVMRRVRDDEDPEQLAKMWK